MNVQDLTFGVEIETTAPLTLVTSGHLSVGGYHRGIQVPYLPEGWKAERDASIRCPAGHEPCEIVSPVLNGAAGLAEVVRVVEILKARGHRVNESCGVHVHVGWAGSAVALSRLIVMVAYAEAGIYASTGTKSRERGVDQFCGSYCKSVKQYGGPGPAKLNLDRERYHLLNLVPLATGRRKAVEFRAFSGSLNATKVCGWIQICMGLVHRAQASSRSPKWSPAPVTGGLKKSGPGASELERLLCYLAWSPSYAAQHDGVSFGWLGGPVSQDAVKGELRRLAKKYDAEV
jgi:hypothetical protein